MKQIKKITSFIVFLVSLAVLAALNAGAIGEEDFAVGKFYGYEEKLLCISHRGDTAAYPENSLEGIKSALKKGADFVSVNVEKTSDGVFYLCEDESLVNICNAPYEGLSQMKSDEVDDYILYDIYGRETKFRITSLERLLRETDGGDGIILDIKPEYKDEIYAVLSGNDALCRVILRVNESGTELSSWADSKEEKVYVIGKYTGNIIFSTVSYIKSLAASEMPAVQYESKNYFNVAFGEFFTNRYLDSDNIRAVAAVYSPDLCGQRSDSADGWNELINKDYSVIETNNIDSFVAYRNEVKRIASDIAELCDKTSALDKGGYSQISIANLEKAEELCFDLLSDSIFSLSEAQTAYSQLLFSLKDMKISSGEVDTRGALNVTAGKVVAAVLVGAALLSGQIYVYKMRKSKRENNTLK